MKTEADDIYLMGKCEHCGAYRFGYQNSDLPPYWSGGQFVCDHPDEHYFDLIPLRQAE